MGIESQSGKGKFRHICPPDNDRSRCTQSLDDGGVLSSGWRIGKHGRSRGGRQSTDIKKILDRDRDAPEHASPDSSAVSAVDGVGFGACGVGEQMHERA